MGHLFVPFPSRAILLVNVLVYVWCVPCVGCTTRLHFKLPLNLEACARGLSWCVMEYMVRARTPITQSLPHRRSHSPFPTADPPSSWSPVEKSPPLTARSMDPLSCAPESLEALLKNTSRVMIVIFVIPITWSPTRHTSTVNFCLKHNLVRVLQCQESVAHTGRRRTISYHLRETISYATAPRLASVSIG